MATGTGNLPHPSMSFSPFAILTAEEMNDLVDNIEALAGGSGVGDGAITAVKLATGAALGNLDSSAVGAGMVEIKRATLGANGDTLTVSSIPARKYLYFIVRAKATGGTIGAGITVNGDTSANYAYRVSRNGAADGVQGSFGSITAISTPENTTILLTGTITNLSSDEKHMQIQATTSGTAGAANTPSRNEIVAKWVNTSNQITSITVTNNGTGDFLAGAELIVFGTN